MTVRFDVTLDEERQIICQKVTGIIDFDSFHRLDEETKACAARLRNPDDVRILVDGRGSERATAAARKAMLGTLRRSSLTRVAVVGSGPFGRVLIRFVSVAAGVSKIRGFADEQKGLDWLLE